MTNQNTNNTPNATTNTAENLHNLAMASFLTFKRGTKTDDLRTNAIVNLFGGHKISINSFVEVYEFLYKVSTSTKWGDRCIRRLSHACTPMKEPQARDIENLFWCRNWHLEWALNRVHMMACEENDATRDAIKTAFADVVNKKGVK